MWIQYFLVFLPVISRLLKFLPHVSHFSQLFPHSTLCFSFIAFFPLSNCISSSISPVTICDPFPHLEGRDQFCLVQHCVPRSQGCALSWEGPTKPLWMEWGTELKRQEGVHSGQPPRVERGLEGPTGDDQGTFPDPGPRGRAHHTSLPQLSPEHSSDASKRECVVSHWLFCLPICFSYRPRAP